MNPTAPWSVKGIDPESREIAKRAARREGITLGAWLNRVIGEAANQGGATAAEELPDTAGPSVASLIVTLSNELQAGDSEIGDRISFLAKAVLSMAERLEGVEQGMHGDKTRKNDQVETFDPREGIERVDEPLVDNDMGWRPRLRRW